ncbi:LAMI_0D08218g1_1 [Lachancea mirantina]|uniref:Transcription and mRNA export factor SUS1 n=1 Tax=Lachancea mirantina TaxID=1230905 RepID=A0A1G4JCT2_9SACH|nr:LAMI_0D08218g1_1 [Lachancea mirantina]
MTSSDEQTMRVKAQIQQYLVQSGYYEKLSVSLNEKLLQDGWMDEVRRITNEEISANNTSNFTQILAKVEPKALDMVSASTRDEVIDQIRTFLSEIVETD